MRPQYFLATPCRPTDPLVGDYKGQPAATRWKVVANQCGTGGGPFQWFHQYYRSFRMCHMSLMNIFSSWTDAPPVMTAPASLRVSTSPRDSPRTTSPWTWR